MSNTTFFTPIPIPNISKDALTIPNTKSYPTMPSVPMWLTVCVNPWLQRAPTQPDFRHYDIYLLNKLKAPG